MTHEERVSLYLSGSMDKDVQTMTESAMLEDANLLDEFISASERAAIVAPPGLADAIMHAVRMQNKPGQEPTPVLSRKLCAAVCFCSAAAVIVFSVLGFNDRLLNLLTSGFGKFGDVLNLITIL